MDHIEKIDYEFDTSFLIGYEAQERGYDIFYYNPKDLFIKENTIQASGYYLELLLDEKNYFNFKSNKIIAKLRKSRSSGGPAPTGACRPSRAGSWW